ncbi:MAG: right-handed parallel beta-helix repeat-containing protein [Candidatus Bathyarchaeales archaeon]
MNKKQVLIIAFIAVFFISVLISMYPKSLVIAQPRPPSPLPYYYIKSDGTIEPSTVPITRVKDEVYMFTGNIIDHTVVVQRDNIVINGAGFSIKQTEEGRKITDWAMIAIGCRPGIELINRRNVTVKNLNFEGCMTGIRLINSSTTIIAKNNFTYNNVAITLDDSHNNTIIENNVINNYGYDEDHRVTCNAIIILFGSYNIITKNNISMNNGGIFIDFDVCSGRASYSNKITMNYIASNKNYGIYLSSNYNATVVGNIIANNKYGVMVDYTGYSTFYHNNFINNTIQVYSSTPMGKPNVWDNGREGNYWSDYNGTDADGDGIGDTSYIIERQTVWIEPTTQTPITFGVDTEDRYPLMKPIRIEVSHDEKNQVTTAEPFPTTWIVAAIAITAMSGATLLIYFTKSRKQRESQTHGVKEKRRLI